MTSLKLSNYSLFSDIDMGRMNYISFVVVQLLIEGWLCHSMDYSTPGFPVHQPSPGVCSNSCPLNQWCHPTNHLILYHPLLLLPSILPSIRIFPISLASGSQSIRASASASILPKNIQGWFPLRLTGWISLLSKRLLSNSLLHTTVWKHQFFSACSAMIQLSHPHMTTRKKHSFGYMDLHQQSDVSAF